MNHLEKPEQPDSVLAAMASEEALRPSVRQDWSPSRPAASSLIYQVYQEYCDRCAAGETVDPDDFCAQHPALQSSLRRLLQAHRFLEEFPELTEDDSASMPQVGDTFLGYHLVLELGKGAFARVFLAMESRIGNRLVVVKISHEGGETEADILGRLQHPNVVPIYSTSHDRETGLTLVCMPYAGCATLHNLLDMVRKEPTLPKRANILLETARQLPYPVPQVDPPTRVLERGSYLDGIAWLGAEIADALAYLHEQGICHRDLKPSNVLLGPSGAPMLLDFNLSTHALQEHLLLGGTVPYMSPEQLQCIVHRKKDFSVDSRSDLFSFGVILYELATGEHPFGPIPLKASTGELAALLLERQEQRSRTAAPLHPALDSSFAAILEKCLAFDPVKRPERAREVGAAFRRRASVPASVGRWIRRHPRLSVAACVLMLVLGSASAAAVALAPPAHERHYQAALAAVEHQQLEEALDRLDRAVHADPNFAPAYFARGRIYQKMAALDDTKHAAAIRDFERAHRLAPSGRNLAAIGFSESKQGAWGAALKMYQLAEDAGFTTAELFNNMGVCHHKLGNREAARASFNRAIDISPNLAAARYNRALAISDRAWNALEILNHAEAQASFTEREIREKRELLRVAITRGAEDFEAALALVPPCGELSFNAGCFYTAAAMVNPEWKDLPLKHFSRAVREQNLNPKILASDARLRRLRSEKAFQALLAMPAPSAPVERVARLADPIPNGETR